MALNALEGKYNKKMHGAFKSGVLNLYGYTSDKGGIRHGMIDIPDLSINEARYFLVICSSFINYLYRLFF